MQDVMNESNQNQSLTDIKDEKLSNSPIQNCPKSSNSNLDIKPGSFNMDVKNNHMMDVRTVDGSILKISTGVQVIKLISR